MEKLPALLRPALIPFICSFLVPSLHSFLCSSAVYLESFWPVPLCIRMRLEPSNCSHFAYLIPRAYLSASSLYSIYPRALWPCVIKSLPSSLFSSLLCFNNTISRVLFSFSSSSLFSYASQISYDKKCSTPSFRFLALGSYWFCNLKWMFFFLFMLYLANSTISLRFALKMPIFNSFSGEGLMWREWICSHNR